MYRVVLYVVLASIAIDLLGCSRESPSSQEKPRPALSSDEAGDSQLAQALVGSWYDKKNLQDGTQIEAVDTYLANGRAVFAGLIKGKSSPTVITGAGTWKIKGGRLLTKIESAKVSGEPLAEKDLPSPTPDKILRITKDEFVYSDTEDGKTTVATRSNVSADEFAQLVSSLRSTGTAASAPNAPQLSATPPPVGVPAAPQSSTVAAADNIYFTCKPNTYVYKYFMSESEETKCETITSTNKKMEEACGSFRMDLTELTPRGGFLVKEVPRTEEMMAESFSLSRSEVWFTYKLTGELSSKSWTGNCYRHTEKFKF